MELKLAFLLIFLLYSSLCCAVNPKLKHDIAPPDPCNDTYSVPCPGETKIADSILPPIGKEENWDITKAP